MNSLHIKKGDTVLILSGEDKGKSAKVLRVYPKSSLVLVEGVNVVKRHQRARTRDSKGQVIEKAMPIAASKVARKDAPKKEAKPKKAKAATK